MKDKASLIEPEQIEQVILLIRGQRVMLDRDLAKSLFENSRLVSSLKAAARAKHAKAWTPNHRRPSATRRLWRFQTGSKLYGVETKNLNKAVQRNLDRFPADFMFQLTLDEAQACIASRYQFGTLKRGQNIKYLPHVFTQEGVAMLSSVLRSPRAVQVNITIMRVFVRLRQTLALHKELARKLAELERKIEGHDVGIRTLFEAIHQLTTPLGEPRREIGFHIKEEGVPYRIKRK